MTRPTRETDGSPLLIIQPLTVTETLTIIQAEWPTVRQVTFSLIPSVTRGNSEKPSTEIQAKARTTTKNMECQGVPHGFQMSTLRNRVKLSSTLPWVLVPIPSCPTRSYLYGTSRWYIIIIKHVNITNVNDPSSRCQNLCVDPL